MPMTRQTDLSLDQLIEAIDDPTTERRCLFVNELGVLCVQEKNSTETEKAQEKLIELLKDEEESVRYPAYMFLQDLLENPADKDTAKIPAALKLFAEDPQNTELMVVICNHKNSKN